MVKIIYFSAKYCKYFIGKGGPVIAAFRVDIKLKIISRRTSFHEVKAFVGCAE
jgi:hypothetical protein